MVKIFYRGPRIDNLFILTRHALVHLDISVATRVPIGDLFYKIFTTCLNLIRFEYYDNTTFLNDTYQIKSLHKLFTENGVKESIGRLQHLAISLPKLMPRDTFNQILSLFTGLKYLYLSHVFDGKRSLYWVDAMFPSLQTILVAPRFFSDRPGHCDNSELLLDNQPAGQKALAFNDLYFDLHSVYAFVKKHSPVVFDLFHSSIDLSSKANVVLTQQFINDDFATSAKYLRSLVIENNCTTKVGGKYWWNTVYPFDIDPILDNFPCLEQLVLSRILVKDTTKVNVSAPSPSSSAGTTETISKSTTDEDKVTSANKNPLCFPPHNRRLKTVKIIQCHELSAEKLCSSINNRFGCKMDYIIFFVLDPKVLYQALDSIGEKVHMLNKLLFGHEDLDNNTIKKAVDIWSNEHRRLNYFEVYIHKDAPDSISDGCNYACKMLKNVKMERVDY